MPATLVIPDVHERHEQLDGVQPLIDEADAVVLLGDFFDSFDMASNTLATLNWIQERIYDDKFTFLWGNHDCHYAFKHNGFMCSGYRGKTQTLLDKEMTQAEWRRFKLYTKVGDFVISHAGFHPKYLPINDVEVEQAIQLAFDGQFHRLWNPGLAVGGHGIGGPTWLRWKLEFEPTDFPQIVGHTPARTVRSVSDGKGGPESYCIDTGFRHVLWIRDSELEVVDLL